VQGYSRRQLKEDKFVETAKDAADWASGHRRPMTWTVAALALVAAIVGGIFLWMNHVNELANVDLGVAMRTLSEPLRPAGSPPPTGSDTGYTTVADRAKAAGKQFQAVADKYGYVKAGKIAHYMQGVAAMQAGDIPAAEQLLKAAAGTSDKNVAALAKMALASLYRSSNRLADAARVYKDVQDHPSDVVSKVQAQLEMAEMYEATNPQEAATIYQQVQKEDPKGTAGQIATSKLAAVR
jgi:hypothetical protein